MGFPGEPPRRQPYDQPVTSSPPAQGQHWFEPAPHDRAAEPPPYAQQPHSQDPRFQQPHPQEPRFPGSQGFQEARLQEPPPQEPPAAQPPSSRPRPEEPKREMWSPYDEGPRARRPIYIAAGALALLVAGGFGLAFLADSDSAPAPAAASPTAGNPVAPPPNIANGRFGFASSRSTDPYALTLNELFKRKKVSVDGRSYLMTTRRADKKCGNAVVGAKLQKALTGARCTQFLRASFRDAAGKIIGTVGVANLKTSAGATKVAKASTGKEREEYIKPLPGKDKVTKFLGTGEAFVGQWGYGHYTVMVWFQYKDGHAPTKTEVKKLNQAAFGVVDATITPALESRALTGKRP
ncbi:hypothetical protein GCM10010517_24040 [Streptosporangium fragile]|uniref:Uncharacterized protein n=1 Tax=Streptosporangium fragile TaxID=46186 RepID=A0ABP6IDE1_9ACTN